MKRIIKFLVLLIAISVSSCHEAGYIIVGNLTGFPDSTMIYLRNMNTDEIFDSAWITGNKFLLKGHLADEPEQLRLYTAVNNEYIYADLLIGNEKVFIDGDIRDLPWNVKISGSAFQDEYNDFRAITRTFDVRRDSLVRAYFNLTHDQQEEQGKRIWKEVGEIDEAIYSLKVEYVLSNANTYPGVINLGYLKNSLPADTVSLLYNSLSKNIKSSKYARVIKVYLNEKITEVGDMYHDFEALDRFGDTIVFSSITGKYVLLDFTNAYCGHCVQAAEELRHIARTYSDSLEIVSFSGNANKDTWLCSLNRDSIAWLSLWDGEGKYSETHIKYGVQVYPSFFLIDPLGKVIDMWAGYGKGSLEERLDRFNSLRPVP